MASFWINILQEGLIYGIMVIGVYITYRILDFPDLSVDGVFPLGISVTAASLLMGFNPYLACILSILAGMVAGLATGILHVKLRISNLLSGILVMIGLYSINLRIMGKSNVPLFNTNTIFSFDVPPILIIAIFALLAKLFLDIFLKTKAGFMLIATGDNPQLVTSLGVDIGKWKIIGLMISNGLVALSGSILAQYQSFADVGMGTGIIVMGLASIIIGQSLLKNISFMLGTSMALIGSIIYRISIGFALKIGFPATDLKLITALIVIAFLSLNRMNIGSRLKKHIKIGVDSSAKNTKSMQNI